MKKFLALFLGSIVCFFGSVRLTRAAGDNKIEVLTDGTVLHYVSTEKIPETIGLYSNYEQEISSHRFQPLVQPVNHFISDVLSFFGGSREISPSTSTKVASGVLGALVYTLSSYLISDTSTALLGKFVAVFLAAFGILYPDYCDWRAGKNFVSSHVDEPQAAAYFKSKIDWSIAAQLQQVYETIQAEANGHADYDGGLVIILRPFNKKSGIGYNTGVWGVAALQRTGGIDTFKKQIELGW